MKYSLGVLIVALAMFGFFYHSHSNQEVQRSVASVVEESTTKEIPKQVSGPTESTVTQIRELSSCLIQDLCGQKRSSEYVYFDAHHTPIHRTLNQSLKLLLRLADSGNLKPGTLSKDDLRKTLQIQNEETQILSLKLWQHFGFSGSEILDLLKGRETIMPRSLPSYYSILLKEGGETKPQITQSLHTLLQGPEINSIYEVTAHLEQLPFTKDDFEGVVQSVCHIQNDPGVSHNWKVIRRQLEIYSHNQGYEINIDQAC